MGCGLKKQNTETGVHLTERTCSPYNPIIKQIVDDCLGLPIYPVTSVDAVIDEEGNTLRKLLEDGIGVNSEELINYINSKLKEVSQTYVTSNQFTTLVNLTLPDTYADKNVVNTLKTLVWAISALSNIRVDNEDDLYADDNKTPRIVEAVTELLSQMRSILGQGSGDTPSLERLNAAVNLLEEVLVAVASFNGGYNPSGKLGLEGNQLQIIKEILDIKASIGDLDNDNTSSSTGNIVLRINYLSLSLSELGNIVGEGIEDSTLTEGIENNSRDISGMLGLIGIRNVLGPTIAQDINTITQDINTINSKIGDRSNNTTTIAQDIKDIKEILDKKANLDPELYELCSNLSGDAHGKYKKLKASEYPVTSIYIFGLEVINFLTDPEDTTKRMFVYFPSGTKLGAETGGGTLNFDFNEDGLVNWRDVATYTSFVAGVTSQGIEHFSEIVSGIECSDRFKNDLNAKSYWNIDSDEEIGTLGDLNALINLVLSGSGFTYLNNNALTGSITSLNVSEGCTRYIFEIIRNTPVNNKYPAYNAPSNSDNVSNAVKNIYMGINEYSAVEGEGTEYFKVIAHPAVDGKLYLNLAKNSLYRYVNKGISGAMISLGEQDMICNYLPAKMSPIRYSVGLNVVTPKCYQVLAKPSSLTISLEEQDLNVSDLRYSIADVTALINFLLSAPDVTSSSTKLNVASAVGLDLQDIKTNLVDSSENVVGNTNLANYNFDNAWSQALTRDLKVLVIVNAIRSALSDFGISDTDLSISQIKAALSGSNIPTGNYNSLPKPTTIPDLGLELVPVLHGSLERDWTKMCYINDSNLVKEVDIPLEGQIYTDMLVAKHDVNQDGKVTINDVTSLINILLSSDTTVKTNFVYYDYMVATITAREAIDLDNYFYTVKKLELNPGKKVFLAESEATLLAMNNSVHRYKRSYIDYDYCLQPDLDDYDMELTVTGWTALVRNGLVKNVVRSPIFLNLFTNKVGMILGAKTVYFSINLGELDTEIKDTSYEYDPSTQSQYGGDQL